MKIRTLVAATVLFALGVTFGCCLGGALVGGPASVAQEVTAPAPTLAPTTEAPVPTSAPTWSQEDEPAVVAPVIMTVEVLERERGKLTDLQKAQYDQEILGESITFDGKVSDVYENGRITINDGQGFFTLVTLVGLPQDVLLSINKGDFLQGMGTIIEVSDFLILSIELQVTSLNG